MLEHFDDEPFNLGFELLLLVEPVDFDHCFVDFFRTLLLCRDLLMLRQC